MAPPMPLWRRTDPAGKGPYIVGLTGGIASGKTTVASHLHSLGASVIDADCLARRAVGPGRETVRAIGKQFGLDVLAPDGTVDRKALAQRVFGHPNALAQLDAIVHPEVRRRLERKLAAARRARRAVVVLDVPLLFEVGMDRQCHEVWVVAVPERAQIDRLMARSGHSEPEARARIKSQWPLSQKVALADHVIWNDGALDQTQKQVEALWAEVQSRIGLG